MCLALMLPVKPSQARLLEVSVLSALNRPMRLRAAARLATGCQATSDGDLEIRQELFGCARTSRPTLSSAPLVPHSPRAPRLSCPAPFVPRAPRALRLSCPALFVPCAFRALRPIAPRPFVPRATSCPAPFQLHDDPVIHNELPSGRGPAPNTHARPTPKAKLTPPARGWLRNPTDPPRPCRTPLPPSVLTRHAPPPADPADAASRPGSSPDEADIPG